MSSWTNCTTSVTTVAALAGIPQLIQHLSGNNEITQSGVTKIGTNRSLSFSSCLSGSFYTRPSGENVVLLLWFSTVRGSCLVHYGKCAQDTQNSQKHKHPALTLVTATLAPLFISWTTLSACPLCDATRRCSESVRTSAASSWLMKQRSRCWNSRTGARGHTEACHSAELWPSCCRKQHRHLSSAANFKDDFPPSSAATDKRRNTCSQNRSGWPQQEGKEQV